MKKVIVLLFMLCYSFVAAQEHYKYAIVPKKFSFFNTNQNSSIELKFLLHNSFISNPVVKIILGSKTINFE